MHYKPIYDNRLSGDECSIVAGQNFVEAEKTSTMLAGCTAQPLPFIERFRLMSQGVAENDAHLTYLGARNVLFEAARLGYGSSN